MAKKASNVQLVHIRMPKDMQRKIQREADKNGQTINAEILKRLESSFQADRQAIELEGLKSRLTRVETHLDRFPTDAKRRLEYMEPEHPGYREAVDELRFRRDELVRQREEIESKIAEAEETQRRSKLP